MYDPIEIDEQVKLSPSQWTILWNELFTAMGGHLADGETALTASTSVLPKEVETMLDDCESVTINVAPGKHAELSIDIDIEGAARDLAYEYANAREGTSHKLLAEDFNFLDCSDLGEGDVVRLFSTKTHSVAIYENTGEYCDNENDGRVTITLVFGSNKERKAYHARKIASINNGILRRMEPVLSAPAAQLRAMRRGLAGFSRKVEQRLAA